MLDTCINKIIKELGVGVRYSSKVKKDAYYFASVNLIVVNSKIPEIAQKLALLHELGHACKHQDNYALYNTTYALHSKMEKDAEEFMIEKMIEVRTEDPDFNPATFNSVNFLESYDLDLKYEPVVKEFMTHYFAGGTMDTIFF